MTAPAARGHATLAAALAAFQAELPKVGKGEKAEIPPKDGKRGYSYTYAGLPDVSEAVLPLLAKHGLAWICRPTFEDGKFVLAYSLLHESGEREDGSYPLGTGTPQQIGSAITYARRYCLTAVTGVAPDADDDGAAAQHSDPWRQPAAVAPPAATVDVDWQNDWLHRVDRADSDGILRGLWDELRMQANLGKAGDPVAQAKLEAKLVERKAELKAEADVPNDVLAEGTAP